MASWSIARTRRQRLLGLALRRRRAADTGMLLPRCRSVHTFGMRYALDLVWLDPKMRVIRVDAAVPPARLRACRAASAVLELPAGVAQRHGLAPGASLPEPEMGTARISTCPR